MLREKLLLTTWRGWVSFASVNIEAKEIKIPSPHPGTTLTEVGYCSSL